MDPREYLRSLRRRWPIIVVATVVALGAAWFSAASTESSTTTGSSYKATTILLSEQPTTPGPKTVTLPTTVIFLTAGEVPKRVADRLGFEGDPEALASTVSGVPDDTGLLRITATAETPERAELVADTFADELIRFLERRSANAAAEQARDFRRRVSQIEEEIEALDEAIGSASAEDAEALKGQREAKVLEAQGLTTQFQDSATAPAGSGLEVIQPAEARLETPPSGETLQAPQSGPIRLAIGGMLGVLGGAALALFLDRFDRRIRTREVAEKSFESAVLAEIPPLPRRRRAEIMASAEPRSPAAEAFRILGTSVAKGFLPDGSAPGTTPDGSPRKVLLITSPGRGEGKTTVVANLAAALAEIGKSVLVISCDFRHPSVHRLFGIAETRSLADALRGQTGGPVLNGHVQDTSIAGVRVVASDPSPERPANLLTSNRMRSVLAEARREADVVLLDTPALLVSSDAANLLEEADAVLLVARAGKTTTDVATHTMQLLRRLNAPKIAVALNGASETSTPRASRPGGRP